MRIYEDMVLVFKNWAVLAQLVGSVSTRENEMFNTAENGERKSINGNGIY